MSKLGITCAGEVMEETSMNWYVERSPGSDSNLSNGRVCGHPGGEDACGRRV